MTLTTLELAENTFPLPDIINEAMSLIAERNNLIVDVYNGDVGSTRFGSTRKLVSIDNRLAEIFNISPFEFLSTKIRKIRE